MAETQISSCETHSSSRLQKVFQQCFTQKWNTRLLGGADEPLYQPATKSGARHMLYYRQDYFASALHEVAHWCIAGPMRRQKTDFDYWYAADGRSRLQQQAFQAAEIKPQALEWFFSRACSYRFQVSLDNLAMEYPEAVDVVEFQSSLLRQARSWQQSGLPERAGLFFEALCREFATEVRAEDLQFSLAELVT